MFTAAPCKDIYELAPLYDYSKTKCKHPVRLLSIDGGGVKGIIPAMVLAEIEKRTRLATCKIFKLISGTSTGAIAAAALSTPDTNDPSKPKYSAEDVVRFYEEKCIEVFPRPSKWTWMWDRLRNLEEPEYDAKTFERILGSYVEDTLFKNALTELVIPSFEISESNPWYFQRTIAKRDPNFKDLKMVEVVRASTAAPTYFDPETINLGGKQYKFVDGGLFADSPAVSALAIAKETFHHPEDDYVAVSLGTGIAKAKIPNKSSDHWGELMWAPKILNITFQASTQAANKMMHTFLPNREESKKYFHFQPTLDSDHCALDDASKENMSYLREKGKELIENKDEELREFCLQVENESEVF